MAKTRKEKEVILAKLKESLRAPSSVFVRFHKLTVADESVMRRALKKEGVSYFVAKKTLMKKALDESGVTGGVPDFEGEIALAYALPDAVDASAAARGVYTFVKQFTADRVAIVGGIYDGKVLGKEGMNEIATIPPLPVLRGMFVNIINSPIQRAAIALGQIAGKK